MQRNTRIIIAAILLTFISLGINLKTLQKIEKVETSKITSQASATGRMNICINTPPKITDHNCTFPMKARMDGLLRNNYSCYINATDPEGGELSYYVFESFADIDGLGKLEVRGNISTANETRPENLTIPITVIDNSSCDNNRVTEEIKFDDISYTGKVIRLQNYTSNESNFIQLKETFTTFHKRLDEYFKDIDNFHLNYEHTFIDLHCFNIKLTIDPVTSLVQYKPNKNSETTSTGPCHAYFTATNPYGIKNQSNIFEIYVEATKEQVPPETSTGGGSGGGGGGGGGMGGFSFSKCYLKDVNCTEWSECIYEPQNESEFNRSADGIQQRECVWSTNCPDQMQPEMRRVCDYKPNCNDAMKNCHENEDGSLDCEIGVDCGGPCPPCPTCNDYIMNQGEKGIDCGGPCEPCNTCNDRVKNCRKTKNGGEICEEKVDCGGPCPACPNCSDQIRNCHILENGTEICEEGVDCGGPCEKCVNLETPGVGGAGNWLNILIYIAILGLMVYPAKILYVAAETYYEKRRMAIIKSRILEERQEFTKDYLAHFDKEIQLLMDDFDSVTQDKVKNEGDRLLTQGQSTGYNIDRYSVSFDNDYADILNDDSTLTINYAMYLQDIDHGRRILKELSRNGIRANYKICKRSSATLWDDKWGTQPNMKYEEKNGQKVARTVEYILSFKPRDKEEAKKIIKLLEMYGKGTQKDKIKGAWDVPDIRVTGDEPLLDYEKNILNTKSVGGQKLLILTKDKPLDGYEHKNIYLNPGLSKFIK